MFVSTPEPCPGLRLNIKLAGWLLSALAEFQPLKAKAHKNPPLCGSSWRAQCGKAIAGPAGAKGLVCSHRWLIGAFSFPLFHWAWTQWPKAGPMKLSQPVVSKWLEILWPGTIEMIDCGRLPWERPCNACSGSTSFTCETPAIVAGNYVLLLHRSSAPI